MSCRRTPADRDRIYVKDEHLECSCLDPEHCALYGHSEGCPWEGHTPDCPGCVICEHRHCTVCTRHLDAAEVHTCVACRGQARRDAAAIVELARLLPDQALEGGRDAHLEAAKGIPGGDALVLMSRGSEGLSEDGHSRVPLPTEPPSWTLGWWESQIREARGLEPPVWMPTNRRRPARSLTQAATFLLGSADVPGQLDWAASSFTAFHVLAADLDTTRRRLEELLYAGDAAAQGVACFTCGHTLERDYRPPKPCTCGPRPAVPHIRSHGETGVCCLGCAAVMRWELSHLAVYDVDPDDPTKEILVSPGCDQGGLEHTDPYAGWHCPRCKRVYSSGEYQLAVKARHDEVAQRMTASDIERVHAVPQPTLSRWANGWVDRQGVRREPLVRKRGKDESGRLLYDVADVKQALADRA